MVKHPSNVNDNGAMAPSMSKNKFSKLVKEMKNIILWKYDYSKFQIKWDILYKKKNMGPSNRHFISQPLEQRIFHLQQN